MDQMFVIVELETDFTGIVAIWDANNFRNQLINKLNGLLKKLLILKTIQLFKLTFGQSGNQFLGLFLCREAQRKTLKCSTTYRVSIPRMTSLPQTELGEAKCPKTSLFFSERRGWNLQLLCSPQKSILCVFKLSSFYLPNTWSDFDDNFREPLPFGFIFNPLLFQLNQYYSLWANQNFKILYKFVQVVQFV